MSQWLSWNGDKALLGLLPERVDIKTRDGVEFCDCPRHELDWVHLGKPWDIMYYRNADSHAAREDARYASKADSHFRQVGGDHYMRQAIQPWEAMEAWMTPEEFRGFLLGNTIKYLARGGVKGERETDFAKAQHYLERLLALESGL